MTQTLRAGDINDFGATELGATLGLDFEGRVFLAGGAFKTLIHGRPPRDLDLWAPTPHDRNLIIKRLLARGARVMDRHPYCDVLWLNGRQLEVPDRAGPSTLESRLARFDLGMSAVGVELAAGRLRTVVHPLAKASVRRRAVLLLKPLVNWKHALGTLARARRYAEELGWTVPADEEDAIWSMFMAQPADEQQRMIDRYAHTAVPGWGVLEEALSRCHSSNWSPSAIGASGVSA